MKDLEAFHATFSSIANTFNCCIVFKNPDVIAEVNVEPNSVCISSKKKGVKFILDNLELQPDSCRGLKYKSGELHFSLRGKQLTESSLPSSKRSRCQMEVVDKIEKLQNQWHCEMCEDKIISDTCFFNRVLPLPSENWTEFTDMWFCHNHGDTDMKQKSDLLPKSRECFVGESYVLVQKGHIKSGAIKPPQNGSLHCKRCSHQLGTVVEVENGRTGDCQVYKLFLHAIIIQDEPMEDFSSTHSNRKHAEIFLSRLLSEQSHMYTSYRFIIESTGIEDGQLCKSTCLVWLLDSGITMFRSETTGSLTTLSEFRALKILYRSQFRTQKSCTDSLGPVELMWRKDNTVHGITLPHPVMLQLVTILLNNMKCLPESQQYLNGFNVSYLCCPDVP